MKYFSFGNIFSLKCKMFGISKFFPVKQNLKADAVKFALEKAMLRNVDVVGRNSQILHKLSKKRVSLLDWLHV